MDAKQVAKLRLSTKTQSVVQHGVVVAAHLSGLKVKTAAILLCNVK